MGLSPQCGKGLFSQSQLPVQTLLQCPFSPHVQSCASTSRCMLKLQNTGSYTIIWTHENTAQTRSRYHCSTAIPLSGHMKILHRLGLGTTVLAAAQSLFFYRVLLPIKRQCTFYIWVLETSVQDTQGLKDRIMLFFFAFFFILVDAENPGVPVLHWQDHVSFVSWRIQKIQDTQDLIDTIMPLLYLGECRKSWTPGFERQDRAFVYVWVVAENHGHQDLKDKTVHLCMCDVWVVAENPGVPGLERWDHAAAYYRATQHVLSGLRQPEQRAGSASSEAEGAARRLWGGRKPGPQQIVSVLRSGFGVSVSCASVTGWTGA